MMVFVQQKSKKFACPTTAMSPPHRRATRSHPTTGELDPPDHEVNLDDMMRAFAAEIAGLEKLKAEGVARLAALRQRPEEKKARKKKEEREAKKRAEKQRKTKEARDRQERERNEQRDAELAAKVEREAAEARVTAEEKATSLNKRKRAVVESSDAEQGKTRKMNKKAGGRRVQHVSRGDNNDTESTNEEEEEKRPPQPQVKVGDVIKCERCARTGKQCVPHPGRYVAILFQLTSLLTPSWCQIHCLRRLLPPKAVLPTGYRPKAFRSKCRRCRPSSHMGGIEYADTRGEGIERRPCGWIFKDPNLHPQRVQCIHDKNY